MNKDTLITELKVLYKNNPKFKDMIEQYFDKGGRSSNIIKELQTPIIQTKKEIEILEANEFGCGDIQVTIKCNGSIYKGCLTELVETNTCDKCGGVKNTNDLVWITSEDFEPRENEIVPEELYSKYDALCEHCYLQEIKTKVVEK